MRVESANINLANFRASIDQREEKSSVRAWVGSPPPDDAGESPQGRVIVGSPQDIADMSNAVQAANKSGEADPVLIGEGKGEMTSARIDEEVRDKKIAEKEASVNKAEATRDDVLTELVARKDYLKTLVNKAMNEKTTGRDIRLYVVPTLVDQGEGEIPHEDEVEALVAWSMGLDHLVSISENERAGLETDTPDLSEDDIGMY